MEDLIRKFALHNAVKYGGKANPGAVIGKMLSEDHSLKDDMKSIGKRVNETIAKINKLSPGEQRKILEQEFPELLEEKKQEEKKELPPLRDPKKVIMRFEPSPSGPLHIGHAYVLGLNALYCEKYKGKLILRIADTNPDNIYPPAYGLIKEDADWLTGNKVKEFFAQSGRLDIYYRYMEKLLALGNAYICTCDPDKFKELLIQKSPCPCRDLPNAEQEQRWKKLFKGYNQGEAVARLKTALQNSNPAMRDFPLFRINETKHPKAGTKHRVWPLMNMAVACDDMEGNITHIIRAKDHADNALRQRYLFDYFKKPFPETLFVGRINFLGMPVSCSKTRPLIEDGTYSGWDDIRLPFLPALRRRGYQPKALLQYAFDVGVSLADKKVSQDEFFKTINAYNKDVVDAEADRFFFVENPRPIIVEDAPERDVELDLHPDTKKGGRRFSTAQDFFIAEEDFKTLKENKMYRLMDCLNFVKKGSSFHFHSQPYSDFKGKGEKIIHWLPKKAKLMNVEVLMPDNKKKIGMGEAGLSSLPIGAIIQFMRFGFCRLDEKKGGKLKFWFLHG